MKFSLEQNQLPDTEGGRFEALVALARFLRSPEGCPWDRAHGSRDFAGFAGEEAEELCEALDSGENPHAEEEFGDVLFTLLACAAAAEAEGRFMLKPALKRAYEKMMRRHEHVFSADRALTPEDAVNAWQNIKAREKEAECRKQNL